MKVNPTLPPETVFEIASTLWKFSPPPLRLPLFYTAESRVAMADDLHLFISIL
jgi:hypothetical protein